MNRLLESLVILGLGVLIGLLLEASMGAPWASVILAVILSLAIILALRSSR